MDGAATADFADPSVAAPSSTEPGAGAAFIAALRRRIGADLAPLASRIDSDGFYPREVLGALGADGAFAQHLGRHTSLERKSLGLAIEATAEIGIHCMSTAFCAWCQNACGWYLENTSNDSLRDRLQPGVASAVILGGTALSNPVKSLSGIESIRLKASRVAGGYRVSGGLPWVSNLGEGHWFGAIFEDSEDCDHRIMAMVQCGQPGVEIRRNVRFIALEGTGTYSVRLRDAMIPDECLLADPLGDMVQRIKPGFILLQAGMGFGVTQGCIDTMRQLDKTLGASNRYLPRGAAPIADDLAALREEVAALAETPLEISAAYLRAVLSARLRVSELTLEAAQAAMLHAGSRGYMHGSPVDRRLRESYFVAIVTPSIRHLRLELDRMARH